jgi:hypothetical protein
VLGGAAGEGFAATSRNPTPKERSHKDWQRVAGH